MFDFIEQGLFYFAIDIWNKKADKHYQLDCKIYNNATFSFRVENQSVYIYKNYKARYKSRTEYVESSDFIGKFPFDKLIENDV